MGHVVGDKNAAAFIVALMMGEADRIAALNASRVGLGCESDRIVQAFQVSGDKQVDAMEQLQRIIFETSVLEKKIAKATFDLGVTVEAAQRTFPENPEIDQTVRMIRIFMHCSFRTAE